MGVTSTSTLERPQEPVAGGPTGTDPAATRTPPTGAPPAIRAGFWIVDPGIARQSQDWICAGPDTPRRQGSTGTPPAPAAGSERDALAQAEGREAWEDEVRAGTPGWADRPLVIAIGDGVSSALRSAEICRLATQTAWRRTFYHLHSPAVGMPPATETPWAAPPVGWPAPGEERDRLLARALTAAFQDANDAVIAAGAAHRRQDPSETRKSATTLSLLAVDGARYFLVHVGDCSVYHVDGRTGAVAARQVEHNRAAEHARQEPAHYAERYSQARGRGLHNTLTRWLGMSPSWAALAPQVLATPGTLAPGDALVLCSDGLDKHVDQLSVARAALHLPTSAAARHLVALANARGGSDHVAVAVLQTRPPAPPAPLSAPWRALRGERTAAIAQRHRSRLAVAAGAVAALLLGAGALAAARPLTEGNTSGAWTGAAQPAATWTPAATVTPVSVSTQCQGLRWCAEATEHYAAIANAPAEARQAAEQVETAAAGAAQAVTLAQTRRSPGLEQARQWADRAAGAHIVAAAASDRTAEHAAAARTLLAAAESADPAAGPAATAQLAEHAGGAQAALGETQSALREALAQRQEAERAAARLPEPTATATLPPPTRTVRPPATQPPAAPPPLYPQPLRSSR